MVAGGFTYDITFSIDYSEGVRGKRKFAGQEVGGKQTIREGNLPRPSGSVRRIGGLKRFREKYPTMEKKKTLDDRAQSTSSSHGL